jgi:uncharacterized protein with NRDE domain
MCLVVVAWRAHPRYRLILAANRDEFHARPAAPLGWWAEDRQVLAGRDLQASGSWLGLARSGHFCALTNFREAATPREQAPSRGRLVADYLMRRTAPEGYLRELRGDRDRYPGFNLLVGNADSLHYFSNRDEDVPRRLPPGTHGLSNHRLGTPWPKLRRTEEALQQLLTEPELTSSQLLELLADRSAADQDELRDTGLPRELERALSAPFVVHPQYGTRCSTAVLVGHDGRAIVHERRFDADARESGSTRIEFMTGETVAEIPRRDGASASTEPATRYDEWPE